MISHPWRRSSATSLHIAIFLCEKVLNVTHKGCFISYISVDYITFIVASNSLVAC